MLEVETIVLDPGFYAWNDLDGISSGAVKASDFFVGSAEDDFLINVGAIPEPSTFGLLAVGCVLLGRCVRRARQG